MALTVTFYKFEKKKNSTKLPTAPLNSVVYNNVELKDDCDIMSPTIVINFAGEYPFIPNYCYIPAFERYYFVNSMRWNKGLWVFGLTVDVLASYKAKIGVQTLYVTRSASASDGTILDSMYPAKTTTTFSNIIRTPFWETTNLENGMFVVGIAGQNTNYYTFTFNALQLFLQYLLGNLYANDLTTNFASLFTSLEWDANPLQFITSINWFPFIALGTAVATIRVGYVDVPVSAGKVDGSGLVFFSHTITPTRHPQASTRGTYLNNAPFSDYVLFYPPFGQIQIDPNVVTNSSSFELLVGVDLRTGKGTLTVIDETNTLILSWLHSQVSLPYQTTEIKPQSTFDASKQFDSITNIAGSIMAKNPVQGGLGAISTVKNAIGDFAQGKIPSSRSIGSNGGMNSLRGNITWQAEFKTVVNDDNTNRGRPLCQRRQINTLSGFILVADADVEIATSEGEQEQIRQYLEGGFFYE